MTTWRGDNNDNNNERTMTTTTFMYKTRRAHITGAGLAGVTEPQPVPIPICTCGIDPHGFTNPWHSLDLGIWSSLHGDPADDILPILCWLLSGLGVDLPIGVRHGIMDHQGVAGGDGSCAIATHNFVACRMDFMIECWMVQSSWKVWDSLLCELCLYHHVTLGAVRVCVFLLMELKLNLLSQCSHSMIGWSCVLGDCHSHGMMWWSLEGMMISTSSGQK